jgi:peroxiredoxin
MTTLALTGALALSACEDKGRTPAAGSAPISAAPLAPPTPVRSGAPMLKEYAPTPQDRLGTLPPGMGVAVGQPAPDFTAADLNGSPASLSAIRQQRGAVLLAFYRGGWCPYCNFEIRELTKAFPQFKQKGVTPIAISVDKVDEAARTGATYEIPFPVLSDPDLHAHEAFRVIHEASPEEVSRLKGFGIDIERSSGRAHHRFAVPAYFLIDSQGVIRWAHADPEYKVRPTVPQLLSAIDSAKLATR